MRRYLLFALAFALCPLLLAQPNFEAPQAVPIDPALRKQIVDRQVLLTRAIDQLPRELDSSIRADVEIYAKAIEWILRHGEYFTKDSPKQALNVIDAGIARAEAARAGKTPWRDVWGKPIVRGYFSQVDGSVQPYSVTLPEGYPGQKKWRLDIVLHGRDQTISEVKFINARENSKGGSKADYIVLESYGRGNNAYRWAGETDVLEGVENFIGTASRDDRSNPVDKKRIVLRGFSMGGAGSWHIGLHHPCPFSVVSPGAGFTTTRGYIKNLPAKLPDYQEACLHIYDAVDYTENAFNVPIIAYSGEKDPQKAAADNIEARIRNFSSKVDFMHVVAPGLEHKQPPEWQAKLDVEFRKRLVKERTIPDHVRFVTYTTRFANFGHGFIEAMEELYTKAVVESKWSSDKLNIQTTNIRALRLVPAERSVPATIEIDGQTLASPRSGKEIGLLFLLKSKGKWTASTQATFPEPLVKKWSPAQPLQGPIDDAFMEAFSMPRPQNAGAWHPGIVEATTSVANRFEQLWDKYLRGKLATAQSRSSETANLILFGDPGSNPLIAKMLPKLPITWTKETLVVNGKQYDASTHFPVLIYPNPLRPSRYVVINSGHTFKEADFKGTNALLYPRLGDWAVMKVTGPGKEPEVVMAGLFDANWQFQK